MNKLLKAGIALITCWFVVVPAFVMGTHAQDVLEQADKDGYEIDWQFKAPLYVAGVVGIVADFAWNISYGTAVYREFPEEFTFTARNTRHLTSGGWRQEKAEEWCELLGRVDPGHCH